MPLIDGRDPDGWIFRAERYFSMNGLTDVEKVDIAAVCLEGPALSWFQWEEKWRRVRTWEDFKLLLQSRFRPTQKGSVEKRFLALWQRGSISEYHQNFETFASPLENLPKTMLEGHFINGLSPEIKTELRVLSPRSLEQMMDLAQRIEERNLVLWGNLARLTLNRGQSASLSILNYQHGGPQPHAQPASKTIAVNSPYLFRPQNSGRVSNQPWKRLSEVEWKSKRDKDLCFRCDEKYMIGHKCKNKKLQVMMIYDEEVEEEEQWVREEEDN